MDGARLKTVISASIFNESLGFEATRTVAGQPLYRTFKRGRMDFTRTAAHIGLNLFLDVELLLHRCE